jgi:beta-glucanase (GH16 family)
VRSEVVSCLRIVAVVVLMVTLLVPPFPGAFGFVPAPTEGTHTEDTEQPRFNGPILTFPSPPRGGADVTQTAAQTHGWGQPTRVEEFDGNLSAWGLYDGPGHADNGRRTPSAATVADGVLTISGDADGNAEGMEWDPGVKYGRWEARVRTPVGDKDYHAVLLLWPNSENWPDDGEVDFMEDSDPTRQRTEFFLHFGNGTSDGDQLTGAVNVDATQWHTWAVEWAPGHITGYLDGRQWWTTTDASVLPPGPMHMTIQLDAFRSRGGLKPSSMQVDWVRYYPITGSGASPAPVDATNPPPPAE